MTIREIVQTLMIRTHITAADLAREMGWTRQYAAKKVRFETLRVRDLIAYAKYCNCEIAFKDIETGEYFDVMRAGLGDPVHAMRGRVMYRNDKAGALANNFFMDGINKFGADGTAVEYYKAINGKIFRVQYFKDDPKKFLLDLVEKEEVDDFIKKYGDTLDRRAKADEEPEMFDDED